MMFVFFFGLSCGLLSPLLLRNDKRLQSVVLAGSAGMLLLTAVYISIVSSPKMLGIAASEERRKEAYVIMAVECLVLGCVFYSRHGARHLFWLGYALNLLLALCSLYIILVLTFFWHW